VIQHCILKYITITLGKTQHAKALSRHLSILCSPQYWISGSCASQAPYMVSHVQLHSSIHPDHPLWTHINFAVSFRCNWLITRLYTLKSLCIITDTIYPHSICLLPSATKVGANGVFTRRLLPITTSLLLLYAPTVL